MRLAICLVASAFAVSCGADCGLGRHDSVTLTSLPGLPNSITSGPVPCCDGFLFNDVSLMGNGDAEFDLANTAMPAQPGRVDAFLVRTSCVRLFNGPYPGAAPLCQVLTGPAAPGGVSARVALAAGLYRVWLQPYSSNTVDTPYVIDVGIWDHSCRAPLQ
jgi:hypothetical protein